jgi:hypothetical protein
VLLPWLSPDAGAEKLFLGVSTGAGAPGVPKAETANVDAPSLAGVVPPKLSPPVRGTDLPDAPVLPPVEPVLPPKLNPVGAGAAADSLSPSPDAGTGVPNPKEGVTDCLESPPEESPLGAGAPKPENPKPPFDSLADSVEEPIGFAAEGPPKPNAWRLELSVVDSGAAAGVEFPPPKENPPEAADPAESVAGAAALPKLNAEGAGAGAGVDDEESLSVPAVPNENEGAAGVVDPVLAFPKEGAAPVVDDGAPKPEKEGAAAGPGDGPGAGAPPKLNDGAGPEVLPKLNAIVQSQSANYT